MTVLSPIDDSVQLILLLQCDPTQLESSATISVNRRNGEESTEHNNHFHREKKPRICLIEEYYMEGIAQVTGEGWGRSWGNYGTKLLRSPSPSPTPSASPPPPSSELFRGSELYHGSLRPALARFSAGSPWLNALSIFSSTRCL
jgi:hypothetical protein